VDRALHTIQTGADLRAARERLGLSLASLARALRMTGANAERHLRMMEAGTRPVAGPVAAAVALLLEKDERDG
jgi:transcriptional regulator with XRE-family HTH domain